MILSDIFQEARDQVDADSKSYSDVKLLRRANAAYEEVGGLLINADGTWQFDDTNYTTVPIGRGTLVEGQSSYSFSTIFLQVEEVAVLDLNNHWHILKPIDQSQRHFPLDDYLQNSGFPEYYDKQGNTISLFPAPAASVVTLTAGLRIKFKRTIKLFTIDDITSPTVQPGFASPWHILLAYKAALPYAASYKKDRVAWLTNEIATMTAGLLAHYGSRQKDAPPRITTKRVFHI